MFSSIMVKTLWERRKGLTFWSLGVFCFALFIGLLYPSIQEVEGIEALIDDMPEAFQAIMGEVDDITTPAGFLGAELFGLVLPLAVAVLAIGFGAATIAREEETGTLEVLLAMPVSRTRILLEKTAAMLISLITVAIAAWLGVVGATIAVDFDINLWHTAQAAMVVALLAAAFGAMALLVTAWGGGRGLAIGITAALFALSYFGNTLAIMVESIEDLRYLSLLHYYDGQSVLEGEARLRNVLVLIVTTLISIVAAIPGFRRRDTGL